MVLAEKRCPPLQGTQGGWMGMVFVLSPAVSSELRMVLAMWWSDGEWLVGDFCGGEVTRT